MASSSTTMLRGTSTVMATTTTTTITKTARSTAPMKVLGKMEVQLVIEAALNQTAIENMFKRAIAKALGVSQEHVVKLAVVTLNSSSRRLQSNETVTYEVSYEVMVPE